MFLLWHPSLTAINLSYTFPILETSATALCGTTGKSTYNSKRGQDLDKEIMADRNFCIRFVISPVGGGKGRLVG